MMHVDVSTRRHTFAADTISVAAPNAGRTSARGAVPCASVLVDIVDADQGVLRLLSGWLTAVGVESRTYSHLGAFLKAPRPDVPGCLLIDAEPPTISGLEPQAILLPLAVRCPIVVIAAAGSVLPFAGAKRGAIDAVAKPLREGEVVNAITKAVDVDRQQRLVASHHAELFARFATLSRREREVLAWVTAGKLNKQIAGDLGLSEITIKVHRGAAVRKMRARSLAELVRMADALGDELATFRSVCSAPLLDAAAADRRSGYTLVR